MAHERDPASEIREKLVDLEKVDLFFNSVLVAVYVRGDKLKSGIIIPDQTRDEDRYQGKAALVVKKGPSAFVDDANTSFNGQNVEIGDWIVIRPSDGWGVTINGVLCRVVQDIHIKARIPSPDVIF
jgi:co-chaperonin GroES (HSP10)